MMRHLRRDAWTGAASLLVSAMLVAAASAQKPDKGSKDNKEPPDPKRPKITLRAQPLIAMAPARVVLTAELVGGDNDFEDFYCPAVEWEWGDGTKSESVHRLRAVRTRQVGNQAPLHRGARVPPGPPQRLPGHRPSQAPRQVGRRRDGQRPGPARPPRRVSARTPTRAKLRRRNSDGRNGPAPRGGGTASSHNRTHRGSAATRPAIFLSTISRDRAVWMWHENGLLDVP